MSAFSKTISVLLIVSFLSAADFAKDPVRAKKGMVVSSESIATEVGVKILKRGGNAIDAAVAVGFTLAVTYPYAGNIGGGGFMVVHLADGRNITIDFREKAPKKAFRNMFLNKAGKLDTNLSQYGWTSSGVPGTVAGLIHALEKYGTMKLKDVIQPAIDLAENGFPVSYKLAASINKYNKAFNRFESSKKIFTRNGGFVEEDGLFIQEDLAKTLTLIKEEGVKGFYEGETARLIEEQSKESGGYITLEDLKEYRPVERAPLYGRYKEFEIVSMPPPASGGVAIIEALNILEHYKFDKDDWGSSYYYKTLTDVLKYVYHDRAKYLGDPDFVAMPLDTLLSKEYAGKITGEISKKIFPKENFRDLKEHNETTHYSVADELGNAVSTTYTINSAYGSKVVVDGAGFLMNNEMDDFSAKPGMPNQFGLVGSEANSIQPGKRMLSSMSPVIVLKNKKPYLVTGSPGGATIITSVLQVVLNVLEFGMNVRDAVELPRIHHQYLPNQIEYEKYGLSKDVKENLKKDGEIIGEKKNLGCVESILIDEAGIFWGAADPRGGSGLAKGI
jgi:gamma-glutamyltranspeptidase/glutathione hydrolase